jgi:hypothetical protein
MSVLARVAAGASADPDAGHWDATRGLHQEEARDCLWASAHDFLLATAEPARLLSLAHPNAPEQSQAQLPRDDWPKAVSRKGPLAARVPRVAPLRALLVLQPVPDDELG